MDGQQLSHLFIAASGIGSLGHYIIASLVHRVVEENNFSIAQSLDDSILYWLNLPMAQFFNQCSRLLQVLGVEAFSKPIVDI